MHPDPGLGADRRALSANPFRKVLSTVHSLPSQAQQFQSGTIFDPEFGEYLAPELEPGLTEFAGRSNFDRARLDQGELGWLWVLRHGKFPRKT
jgi:hypothetical protein